MTATYFEFERSRGQTAWTYKYINYSISWEPFAWQTSNYALCRLLHHAKSKWPLMILRSKVKESTGHMNELTSQYLENPLLDRHQTLYKVHCTSDVNVWKFRGQTGHKRVLINQYLDNPLLVGLVQCTWLYWFWHSKVKLNIGILYWPLNILRNMETFAWFTLNFIPWYMTQKIDDPLLCLMTPFYV